ncbi:DsrE family protein [Streptomyces sp. 142MFCol3.1]|uniref:DsrE family protein n=1 Tax=Streptomyces sp. 142MFCol3.1 TaxID=1172179 RepID=UPI00099730FE|nr:DsrE family protein [Streptomyces sp. 142MFCol3.1]
MSGTGNELHIDIPVELANVNTVFSVPSLTFEGDLPASISHLRLITDDVTEWNAESEIIAIFHTNAGHVVLNDAAYNVERKITEGNPYRQMIADLVQRGVKVELCGATAKAHGWGNSQLLPGVVVNRNAMARTVQLVQEGFVKSTE